MRVPMKQAVALGLLAVVAGVTFAVLRSRPGSGQTARAAQRSVDADRREVQDANLYMLDWTASTNGEDCDVYLS